MDEKDFELLQILAETRNITRAADQLYVTQSALSKRLKLIEEELGIQLLLRSRQGICFTPAGEAVLQRSAAAAKELAQMRQELSTLQDEVCGTLNAGISINYARYRLPGLLEQYAHSYPKVKLHISTGRSARLYRELLEGKVDVTVLRGEYDWDGEKFLVSQENICVVCGEGEEGKTLDPARYINHATDPVQSAMILRWLREQNITEDSGFSVDNVTTCRELVERGLGWSLLPEVCLEGFKGHCTPCAFDNGEPFIRRTWILARRDAMVLPQVRAFWDMIKEYR